MESTQNLMNLPAVSQRPASTQWSTDEAQSWMRGQTWRSGCNLIPSTSINQLEMWQEESFDLATIRKELGLARSVGMTLARVYLHDLLHLTDPNGLRSRMTQYLEAAEEAGVQTLFVFFDDCWNAEANLGPQPKPLPGVHNSGWVRSPSHSRRNWPDGFGPLEAYVKDVIGWFSGDKRVFGWDLYNEPGNNGYGDSSLPLLEKVFEWAWEIRPSQPLTSGVYADNWTLNEVQLGASDIISFHNYLGPENLRKQIDNLRSRNRPVICTEWMARTSGSLVSDCLKVFKQEGVSCFQWGLVSGKTNTIYPWGSSEGHDEPDVWFHDLFRPDGSPYDPLEVDEYRTLTLA